MNIDEPHGEGNQLKPDVLKWITWDLLVVHTYSVAVILLLLMLSIVQQFCVSVFLCTVHVDPSYLTEHAKKPFGCE